MYCGRRQTAEMIQTSAQRPHERKEYLQKCIRDFADLPNDSIVKAFGMTLDPSFMKVNNSVKSLAVYMNSY
jgi:hypothetical protein